MADEGDEDATDDNDVDTLPEGTIQEMLKKFNDDLESERASSITPRRSLRR